MNSLECSKITIETNVIGAIIRLTTNSGESVRLERGRSRIEAAVGSSSESGKYVLVEQYVYPWNVVCVN